MEASKKKPEQLPHMLEVLKIVEGALNADHDKVRAYTEQLVSKLSKNGDEVMARRLKRILGSSRVDGLGATHLMPGGRIPVDSEARLSLADEEHIELGEVKVFLNEVVSARISEFLRYVQHADRLVSQGVGISPSLLLFGPSGCGKTEVGRYVASQMALPLMTARTDALISSYLGSTAKNIRLLFEHAMSRPCVLFLDEFDAIAKLRDDRYELGELKRVVVSLLQNIDALDKETILIAATNHEHLLDPAVWRRFAFKVHLAEPSLDARYGLYARFLSHFSQPDDIRMFAEISNGLSGDDIRQLSEDSKRAAILDESDQADPYDVIRRILDRLFVLHKMQDSDLAIRLNWLRKLNPGVFSYRRLSKLFDVSTGKLSYMLRSE